MLATHFGRDLDRKTLWTRIGTAIPTAAAAVQDADMDRFVSTCLEHVKASPGLVAADPNAAGFIGDLSRRTVEWRTAFMRYLSTRSYAVLVFSRTAWENVKADRLATRQALEAEAEVANG